MDSNEKIPFNELSKKWVKILRVAFDAMEKHGHDPETFLVSALYSFSEIDNCFIYGILFYPDEIHWMDVGNIDVDDYSIVINAETLEFIRIFQGRN